MTTRHFSLVEVIVASVILLITVVGIPSFYFANRRNLRRSHLKRLATWQATYKMEELKAQGYDGINTDSDTVELDNVTADRNWVVEPCDGELDCKKVTVIVSWGENNSTSLVTIIAQY
ncbi:MAG: type IV pilus modification PilV family protein [Planctomycetota bacterium]